MDNARNGARTKLVAREAQLAVEAERRRLNTLQRRRNCEIARATQDALLQDLHIAPSSSLHYTSSQGSTSSIPSDRIVSKLAKEIALDLFKVTCKFGLDIQKKLLDKMILDPISQESMPFVVVERKKIEDYTMVCEGLANPWTGLKYGKGKDQYLAQGVLQAVVLNLSDKRSIRAIATCVGPNKHNVRKAKIH